MLTLLGSRAQTSVGLDLSQNMLNMARLNVAAASLSNVTLRYGDIHKTGLPDACADLVVIHQVLHYLAEPAGAVLEAGPLVKPDGQLVIVDFEHHSSEQLRELHRHRWLGISDSLVADWTTEAGLHRYVAKTIGSESDRPAVKVWICR